MRTPSPRCSMPRCVRFRRKSGRWFPCFWERPFFRSSYHPTAQVFHPSTALPNGRTLPQWLWQAPNSGAPWFDRCHHVPMPPLFHSPAMPAYGMNPTKSRPPNRGRLERCSRRSNCCPTARRYHRPARPPNSSSPRKSRLPDATRPVDSPTSRNRFRKGSPRRPRTAATGQFLPIGYGNDLTRGRTWMRSPGNESTGSI
jgi:hypothetical protein